MQPTNGNPLIPYNQTRLAKGALLVHKEVKVTPIVAIDIWVKTGAVHDPDPHFGISHFYEHMFFKGTEKYGVGVMDRIITSLGGYNNAATSLDFTHYYVVLPKPGWKEALDVLVDSVLHPLFPEDEIERERSVIVEEIKRHEDNPWSKIYDEFARTAFSRCPYSRQVLGSVESLQTITRDSFLRYHHDRYRPDNIAFCIAGDVSYEETVESLNHYLSNATHPADSNGAKTENCSNADESSLWQIIDAPAEVTLQRDVNQSYLLLGYPTPKITGAPHEYALDLLSTILGEGRSSRLYRRLNDELGIVSSISASYWNLANAGLFIIEAVTEPSKLEQVESEIQKEFIRLRKDMKMEELNKAKSMLRADFAFANEKVISIAQTYGYGEATATVEHGVYYQDRIEEITREEIEAAFDAFLGPERLCKGLLIPKNG
jgi:zinc protease